MAATDENTVEELQQELALWKQKFHEVQAKLEESGTGDTKTEQRVNPLLFGIDLAEVDRVKDLVKSKKITLNDVDKNGQTLLIIAAWYGYLDVVSFCINSGFNVNAIDNEGKSGIDRAAEAGHYHCEQMLLFARMNVSVGHDIKKTADALNEQIGSNNNIMNELTQIGATNKQLFEQTLMELMVRIINQRLVFDDTLLHLCWNIACRKNKNPLDSELWQAIKSSCCYVIESKSKRDWYWLKNVVIPSTLWFQEAANDGNKQYLYFELLKWVDTESMRQLQHLEDDLNILANKNRAHFDELAKWDTTTLRSTANTVRQDAIPNALVSHYTYTTLVISSGTTFDSPKFYDYNEFLSQMILLAQIVDDDFQRSVQEMFKVDCITGIGAVSNMKDTDEKSDDMVHYMRGPVKLMERARVKAQTDYHMEAYPTVACVIDINRCSLIFNDISTLLNALQLFVNKVKYFQSGNIIGIARVKNGFMEYVKETQYADIKLNVLIKGAQNNIVGEVQFLLDRMKRFKDRAHNLYAIQRQKEVFEESAERILPLLMHEYKQIRIAGSLGDVKALCRLQVINNKSVYDLLQEDDSQMHILMACCHFGHNKAFVYLSNAIPKEKFIAYLTSRNHYNMMAIEYAISKGRTFILSRIFDMPEIRKLFEKKEYKYELIYWLFAKNTKNHVIDFLLKKMNVSKEDIIELLPYHPEADHGTNNLHRWAHYYHLFYLITEILRKGKINTSDKLLSIVGEETYCKYMMLVDALNTNALESNLRDDKMPAIEFLLADKSKRLQYIVDTYKDNDVLLYRLIYILFAYNQKRIDLVLFQKLGLSKEKVAELLTIYEYKYDQDVFQNGTFAPHPYAYPTVEYGSVLNELIRKKSLKEVQYLLSVIGKKAFVICVFKKEKEKTNVVQTAIECKKMDLLKYIMSVNEVLLRCNEDKNELLSIISTLNECDDADILKYVVETLKLDKKKTSQSKVTNKELLALLA